MSFDADKTLTITTSESLAIKIDKLRTQGEQYLLSRQQDDGSWVGEVELNPGPTAQVIMLHATLQMPFPKDLAQKARNYIIRKQNPDGGWSTHFGTPSDVSVTAECYVALRLLGDNAEDSHMTKATQLIQKLGGLSTANPWTQLYLSILGVIPWQFIHKTPIEIMSIPSWFPIQLNDLSYWVKVITIPMALVGELGPNEPISIASQLQSELRVNSQSLWVKEPLIIKAIRKFLKGLNFIFPKLKENCVKKALTAINEFREESGDFGGNTCTAINVLVAYNRIGKRHSQEFEMGFRSLMSYGMNKNDEWRMQCCQSHIWDTSFTLSALRANKISSPTLSKAINWLKDRQITKTYGPWARNVEAEPGGWCFGNRHDHFPVTDCTATSLLALAKQDKEFYASESARKGIMWLKSMQHKTGGWSAYEKFGRGQILNKIFQFKDIADGLIDPPKADVTSKVVEALCLWRRHYPELELSIQSARKFLLNKRELSGLWRGNYGINYIYGTAFSARALRSIDKEAKSEWADPIRSFFVSKQNPDGGWGESEASYKDISKNGIGPSTVTQTAWALLALAACYNGTSEEIKSIFNAIRFIELNQNQDGSWDDSVFLGTVFPGAVYFKYEYYSLYFPLLALDAIAQAISSKQFS